MMAIPRRVLPDISASADAVFLRGTATTSEEIQIGSKFALA